MTHTNKNTISGKTILKMWREAAGNARLLSAAIFPRIKAADSENTIVITPPVAQMYSVRIVGAFYA
ncbi:MAG: hypothetical protein HDR36_03385 [Treponema sp.]|nr:hypothetical protein [Treponema sp.]